MIARRTPSRGNPGDANACVLGRWLHASDDAWEEIAAECGSKAASPSEASQALHDKRWHQSKRVQAKNLRGEALISESSQQALAARLARGEV